MKTKTLAIDASVFISGFIEEDTHHKISKNFLARVKKHHVQVLIPVLTIFEVLKAHHRRNQNLEATDKIYMSFIDWNLTRQIRFLNLEADFFVYFSQYHHLFDLKTSDTILAVMAKKINVPLITWDKKLINNVERLITAMTPVDFMQKNRR